MFILKIFNYLQNNYTTSDEIRKDLILLKNGFNQINEENEFFKKNFKEYITEIIKTYNSFLQKEGNKKKNLIRKLFFEDFIPFYDNYFSVINNQIYYFTYHNNIFEILSNKINQMPINTVGEKIKLLEDINENKYLDFKYYIIELEKLVTFHMGIEKKEIRNILYKIKSDDSEEEVELFYKNLLKKRIEGIKFNDLKINNLNEEIFINKNSEVKEIHLLKIYQKYFSIL